MSKTLKVFNIITFVLICLAEIVSLYFDINLLITYFAENTAGKGFGLAVYLYFSLICLGVLLVLCIIQSILYKVYSNKANSSDNPDTLPKTFKVLPWIFLLINIILVALSYFLIISAN